MSDEAPWSPPDTVVAMVKQTADVDRYEKSRGVERLIAFCDAVVAIAITLVALPLVDIARGAGGGSVGAFFSDNRASLIAAGTSFLAISFFWHGHRRLYQGVVSVSERVMWLNTAWLAGIVFLPIATVLNVGHSGANRGALLLYVGTITVILALRNAQASVLDQATGTRPGHWRMMVGTWVSVGLLLIGIAAIAATGWRGSWALLILLATRPIRRLVTGPTPATDDERPARGRQDTTPSA